MDDISRFFNKSRVSCFQTNNSRWQVEFQHQLFPQICAEGLPITSRPHEHRVPVDPKRNVSSSNVGIAIINHPPVLTIDSWYKLFPDGWFIGIPTVKHHKASDSYQYQSFWATAMPPDRWFNRSCRSCRPSQK